MPRNWRSTPHDSPHYSDLSKSCSASKRVVALGRAHECRRAGGGLGLRCEESSNRARLPVQHRSRAGVANTPEQKAAVMACVDELAELGAGEEYTKEPTLCGTWQLAFTTEKARPALLVRRVNIPGRDRPGDADVAC